MSSIFSNQGGGPDRPPQRPPALRRMPRSGPAAIAALLLILGGLVGAFYWMVVRVEVDGGELLVLVRKTGEAIPEDLAPEFRDQVVLYPALAEAIAAESGKPVEKVLTSYKGIVLEPLGPGRHFKNPYTFKRKKFDATFIDQNEVGVLVRRFGKPLPMGKTVATSPDERGPVREILSPGRHNINLLAYEVMTFPVIEIPPGHVGVVTLLSGTEPKEKNSYTVAPGERGVQETVLRPGREYYNPYEQKIDIVDMRSQIYDMRDADAIQFPSNDSFSITMEGTIEWRIREDSVAQVTVAYGDELDILNKIILPNARSIARIQGSKLQAREFISGTTRRAFQDHLLNELREKCWQQGIKIEQALVREIQPPAEIASLISQREQAEQEIERSTNQMEEAKAQVLLVEQQEMQARNRMVGDARRDVVTVLKTAEQHKVVNITNAQQALEVARIDLEAAAKEAAAIEARGQAEANVVLFDYQAQAEPLASAVAAFGDGTTYAQQFFFQKVAPSIHSILSNTEGPFADIFLQFQNFEPTTGQGGGQ